jgi:hypothetical protein
LPPTSFKRRRNASFKSGTADETTLQTLTARIGTLNGELRAAHLIAHLETRRLLSNTQVTAHNAERGYGKAGGTDAHTGHQH